MIANAPYWVKKAVKVLVTTYAIYINMFVTLELKNVQSLSWKIIQLHEVILLTKRSKNPKTFKTESKFNLKQLNVCTIYFFEKHIVLW